LKEMGRARPWDRADSLASVGGAPPPTQEKNPHGVWFVYGGGHPHPAPPKPLTRPAPPPPPPHPHARTPLPLPPPVPPTPPNPPPTPTRAPPPTFVAPTGIRRLCPSAARGFARGPNITAAGPSSSAITSVPWASSPGAPIRPSPGAESRIHSAPTSA